MRQVTIDNKYEAVAEIIERHFSLLMERYEALEKALQKKTHYKTRIDCHNKLREVTFLIVKDLLKIYGFSNEEIESGVFSEEHIGNKYYLQVWERVKRLYDFRDLLPAKDPETLTLRIVNRLNDSALSPVPCRVLERGI